jgi:serine/threonine protein kinase
MMLVPEQAPSREEIDRHVSDQPAEPPPERTGTTGQSSLEARALSEGAFELGAPLGTTPGEVYETTHPRLAGRFAIKLLKRARGAAPEAIERFRGDVERISGLRHPNIAEVIELGAMADGTPVVVSERLQGQTLAERMQLRRDPMPLSEVVPIVRGAAKALEAAHGAGVVHGEIRPDNIYLAEIAGYEGGFVKLLDFGMVHLELGEAGQSLRRMDAERARYLSPEQVHVFIGDVRAADVDARSDQFSLAVVAYRLCTGRDPFAGDDLAVVMERVASGSPTSMTGVPGCRCDPRVAAVIDKALERDPRNRFESVHAFARALEDAATAELPRLRTTPVMDARPDAPAADAPASAPAYRDDEPAAPAPTHAVNRKPSLSVMFFEEGERKERGAWSAQDLEQFEEDGVRDHDADGGADAGVYDSFDELPRRRRRVLPWLVGVAAAAGALVWWSGWRPSSSWLPWSRSAPTTAAEQAAPVAEPAAPAAEPAAAVPAVAAPSAAVPAPEPAGAPAPVPAAPTPAIPPAAEAAPAAPVPASPPAAQAVEATPPPPTPSVPTPAVPPPAQAAPGTPLHADPAIPAPAREVPPVQIIDEPPPRPRPRAPAPLRGYVWSPKEQRLVPAQ